MAKKKRILLIEDKRDIASIIKLQAEASGYKLDVEVDGINGYLAIESKKPDLIILDIMLPGQNGLDVYRKVKNGTLKSIPIIILSAKADELDIVLGLELGADDYVAKPFSPKVLFSRVKALLRRETYKEKTPEILNFGEFTLEIDRYILWKGEKTIPVTLSELGILKRLLANQGKVLTRDQLLHDINNHDSYIVDRNSDVHIASLPKKLGPKFQWIETVRGVGYRLKEALDSNKS